MGIFAAVGFHSALSNVSSFSTVVKIPVFAGAEWATLLLGTVGSCI